MDDKRAVAFILARQGFNSSKTVNMCRDLDVAVFEITDLNHFRVGKRWTMLFLAGEYLDSRLFDAVDGVLDFKNYDLDVFSLFKLVYTDGKEPKILFSPRIFQNHCPITASGHPHVPVIMTDPHSPGEKLLDGWIFEEKLDSEGFEEV